MSRVFNIIAVSLATGLLSGNGVAQVAPVRPEAPPEELNEVLAQLASVDRSNLPRVQNELRRLSVGTREGGQRGGGPTRAERAQIAANPAFAAAFDHNPDSTLNLLRWVNEDIRASQTRASAR